jgi:hypothetical protein
MAHKGLIVALGMISFASPVAASQPEPAATMAPPGTPETRYCLRIEPVTGTLVETVQCWTRDEWAYQDVDVDKVWAKDGVRVEA